MRLHLTEEAIPKIVGARPVDCCYASGCPTQRRQNMPLRHQTW